MNSVKARYYKFNNDLNNVDVEPLKVFDPLPQKAVDELVLIREVSADLQAKKDEDMRRIAQAAKEAEQKAVEDAKNKPEEETTETA